MIVFDTETTGKIKSSMLPLEQQPEIIELAAVKLVGHDMTESARMHLLIRPKILPLSEETTKITGLTTEQVSVGLTFPRHVMPLTEFFLGEEVLVAHNISFDVEMLALELRRVERHTRFPWPHTHIDTVELTMDLEAPRQRSARLKLSELYEAVLGRPMGVKHRAMEDTLALCEIVRALRIKDGRI